MQMFNNLEINALCERVVKLLYKTQAVGPVEDKLPLFAEIRSLLSVLEKNARPLDWYRTQYPNLRFVENESLPIDVRMGVTATRAEAVDMCNQLRAEGLMFYRVNFGPYGDFVEPTRDTPESTALDTMRHDYGQAWNCFRNQWNDTYNFIKREPEEEDAAISMAISMADECKTRWPWAWIVVKVPILDVEGEPVGREAKQVRK